MQIGKLPNDVLKDQILSHIAHRQGQVLQGPAIGQDCGVFSLNGAYCAASSDPITGASEHMGYLGVHVACNDIAAAGGTPIGVLSTLLAPPDTELQALKQIMLDAERCAKELGIDILGGHTEITDAVTRITMCLTAIGQVSGEYVDRRKETPPRPGCHVVMTKTAGLEGSAILARERHDDLSPLLDNAVLERCRAMMERLSVLPEGRVGVAAGALLMHDVTEGGILGALWEIAEAAGCGITVQGDRIPVDPATAELCAALGVDPLRLISSGSMVLVTQDAPRLLRALADASIQAADVAELTEGDDRRVLRGASEEPLCPPESDQLYHGLAAPASRPAYR